MANTGTYHFYRETGEHVMPLDMYTEAKAI